MGLRLVRDLPAFLRRPVRPAHARAVLRRRLERREADFLALVRRAVYDEPASPYRRLLHLAGCERGDFERLVGQEGVEGALEALLRQGVYLTVEEFKGRRPVVRGSASLAVQPSELRTRRAVEHLRASSSGSRGAPTSAPFDLARARARAIDTCLTLEARRGLAWRHAVWGVPGAWAIVQLLQYSLFGRPAARWFSQVDPAAPGLPARYRRSERALRWGSVLAGRPLPTPRHAPLDDPLPVARWMAATLRTGQTPHVVTFASTAVRLCLAASAAGLDLRGAQLSISGEPTTAARLATIERAGARAVPAYGSSECGMIASGCLAPAAPDEMHLFGERLALIHADPSVTAARLPARAVLATTLRATAPYTLLNVSLGDEAALGRRACGCPLERLGWTTHLHTVRSFEKLTAGGMALLDADIIRILEVVLPARFGGGPTDYQLLEEEDAAGRPGLRLLVHPSLGPLDTRAVAEAFLGALGGGSAARRVMELQWRQAGLPRVERRAPLTTANGKVLHLHQQRGEARAAGQASPSHR